MKVDITRSFIYDPEKVKEAERLYKELGARVIIRELQKEKLNINIQGKKEVVA